MSVTLASRTSYYDVEYKEEIYNVVETIDYNIDYPVLEILYEGEGVEESLEKEVLEYFSKNISEL